MEKLYIKFKTTGLDEEHEFKKNHSEVYGYTEYVWNGYLKKNWDFSFVDENGRSLPYDTYNGNGGPGITTDTELTNTEFEVRNALVRREDNFIYYYTNEDSMLKYHGKWRKVYLYIRVYEDEANCRWLALNLQHDVEDDILRLKAIGLINDDTPREEALRILASREN